MTAATSLDLESFQETLSNAFVVQESGMDVQSLSTVVELQGAIATGELGVDAALDLIAVGARNVASATGIAIGLLKADQLEYRAGCGSAVAYVGRQVMATLCVSGQNAAKGEILRVENAQIDTRIEAAICRQFEAQSLLILPIYHDRNLSGLLAVIFDDAHTFQPPEVRSYRLMAALVEQTMSRPARVEQKTAQSAYLLTMQHSFERARPETEESPVEESTLNIAADRVIDELCEDPIAETASAPVLKASARAWFVRFVRTLVSLDVSLGKAKWEMALATAAVLALVCGIAYRDHRSPLPAGGSALQPSNPIEQPMPIVLPAKRDLGRNPSKPQTQMGVMAEGGKRARAAKRWVRVGNNELDSVTEDVTVRYFTPQPTLPRVFEGANRVRHISDDVTIRYFTPQRIVAPSPVGSTAQPERHLPTPGKSANRTR